MITNLAECQDQFGHMMKIGDVVLYRAEGKSPTSYKGKIKTIQVKDNESIIYLVLTITAVTSTYDAARVGTDTKKLQSWNVFALQP